MQDNTVGQSESCLKQISQHAVTKDPNTTHVNEVFNMLPKIQFQAVTYVQYVHMYMHCKEVPEFEDL